MNNQELIDLDEALSVVRHLKCNQSFGFALARNNKKLAPVVAVIRAAGELRPEYEAYEKARVESAREHAEKDADGNPELMYGPTGQHYRIEDDEAWDAALEQLRAEHADAIAHRDAQKIEVEALMKAEAEKIEWVMIPHADFPEGITSAQMECLLPMIVTQPQKA